MSEVENSAQKTPAIPMPGKQYLGDGVYANYDGFHIILTTEDGIQTTNRIAIDGEVWRSLERYANRLMDALRAARGAEKNAGQ